MHDFGTPCLRLLKLKHDIKFDLVSHTGTYDCILRYLDKYSPFIPKMVWQ